MDLKNGYLSFIKSSVVRFLYIIIITNCKEKVRQIKMGISEILKINRYHATYERVATQNQHVSTKYQTHLKQKVKLNILRVLPNLALPEEVSGVVF